MSIASYIGEMHFYLMILKPCMYLTKYACAWLTFESKSKFVKVSDVSTLATSYRCVGLTHV